MMETCCKKSDVYPGPKRAGQDNQKDLFILIKKAPVVKKPGKQAEINQGKYIYGFSCPVLCIQYFNRDFNQQHSKNIIHKGIVSRIDNLPSYHPYCQRKNNTHTQYKLNSRVHEL